ncbi:hypothetical protein Nepgr_022103 [Nepenthes gracilis]|uniref:Pentatricopeptide repeat-containing protein n=1 Tax=Nepenthes gracilis TaxID=150966 RepID=A0AAD3XWH7_NEPGR|nr:hypothetical protein Nepgr_022103 [Nepenthes gracilis]
MEIQFTLKICFRKPSKTPKFVIPFYTTRTLYISDSARPKPPDSFRRNVKFLAENFANGRFESLTQKLNKKGSSPLQVLKDDGDWSEDQFWAVIEFLAQTSSFEEIPRVFDMWKNLSKSRIEEFYYSKIVIILSEVGLLDDAASALQEMKTHGLEISSDIYNSIIHGFANKGKFDDALLYLKEMEDINLRPDTQTYDGLIEAYGKFKMYDEMVECFKRMERNGLSSDHITYNLLIREFSRGGLFNRMERMCQTLLSKKMGIQSSTLVAMLEAYADFNLLGKMEKVYRKVIISNTLLKEDLIRKLARVYIQNYMFSRLDYLANDLSLKSGRTDLFWCLCLLSWACLLSKKGIDSVLQEMEEARVPWNVTVANIVLLTCLKMKDFKCLKVMLMGIVGRRLEPDIITFGILYDAKAIGFHWSQTLKIWEKIGFLDGFVEMNTDPLVLSAFGKGGFLRILEERYTFLEPQAREEKWTYRCLIEFVLRTTDGGLS